MVYVDHLISSTCFEPVNGGLLHGQQTTGMKEHIGLNNNEHDGGQEGCSSKGLLAECRICQEEDDEKELEVPCACNGTLKFAHRKCIQKWCNKKGDIFCEICNQVYAPNYSVPPSGISSDGLAINISQGEKPARGLFTIETNEEVEFCCLCSLNDLIYFLWLPKIFFRQNWSPRVRLHDPHIQATAAAEHGLLHIDYEDYAVANTGGIVCCRSVALILMLLLLVRHAVTFMRDSGLLQESLITFNISLLQFAGFLLPCYVILRMLHVLLTRRRRQVRQ